MGRKGLRRLSASCWMLSCTFGEQNFRSGQGQGMRGMQNDARASPSNHWVQQYAAAAAAEGRDLEGSIYFVA